MLGKVSWWAISFIIALPMITNCGKKYYVNDIHVYPGAKLREANADGLLPADHVALLKVIQINNQAPHIRKIDSENIAFKSLPDYFALEPGQHTLQYFVFRPLKLIKPKLIGPNNKIWLTSYDSDVVEFEFYVEAGHEYMLTFYYAISGDKGDVPLGKLWKEFKSSLKNIKTSWQESKTDFIIALIDPADGIPATRIFDTTHILDKHKIELECAIEECTSIIRKKYWFLDEWEQRYNWSVGQCSLDPFEHPEIDKNRLFRRCEGLAG